MRPHIIQCEAVTLAEVGGEVVELQCAWSAGHPADGRDVFAYHVTRHPRLRSMPIAWCDQSSVGDVVRRDPEPEAATEPMFGGEAA